MVTKSNARVFDSIERENLKVYHKSHINKTVVIAFTAYAFKDRVDNGGDTIILIFLSAKLQSHIKSCATEYAPNRWKFESQWTHSKEERNPMTS